MIAYQTQSINPRVLPGELGDVSLRKPKAKDRKWEKRLGNPKEGYDVRMGEILPPQDLTVEPLIQVESAFLIAVANYHAPV